MPRQPQKQPTGKKSGGGKATSTTKGKTTSQSAEAKSPSVGMTVQEAGKRGGDAVKKKYGPEFYSQIGQKGGEKIQAEAKRFRELKESGKL